VYASTTLQMNPIVRTPAFTSPYKNDEPVQQLLRIMISHHSRHIYQDQRSPSITALSFINMSTKKFDRSAYTISKTSTQRPTTSIDPPSSTVLPAGHAKSPINRSLPWDVHYEHNHTFTIRDDRDLSIDIFRPVSNEPVPAIIMWSPYGKSGTGPWNLGSTALRSGVPEERPSG
jgi:hypothetical protein